jgi:hypothetical protein
MASRKKTKKVELEGQADPRAALDSAAFLSAAAPVLARLERDLLERGKASPSVLRALEARYEAEKQAKRTAESFAGWSEALATQVAAAWLLSCVFVRTLEDRGLLKQARIAGAGAEDSQREFFQLAPSLTERDYLLTVFRELSHYPAAKDLFDAEHSLVWKLSPSAEAAKELLALFRAPSAREPAFRFGQASTRFLGDFYQDISEDVRKRYALLQTPDFIEAFILDRTLEPAIARFGLDDTTLIDPTCGSGHFLLGAFDRLFDHHLRVAPNLNPRVAAVKALDCVFGADINPYAVAIARFRLTLSFLEKADYKKVADAPALPLHLVVADSLRINPQHPQQEFWQQNRISLVQWIGDVFTIEDERAAHDVLFRQYAAVVGNPPYITVKDAAVRDVYRSMYQSAAMQYSLSAPFCERFFQFARLGGYTGQITANSFMKREFGKALIEKVIPSVNLECIVNTSGAFIPGHGTPTVLLFGTHEPPQGESIHTVLAKRGEPSVPDDPGSGLVWRSIADHGNELGFENEYISVERRSRDALRKHPWSLGGGGVAELMDRLRERAPLQLGAIASEIGSLSMTRADDIYVRSRNALLRAGITDDYIVSSISGENVRDWSIEVRDAAAFPYERDLTVTDDEQLKRALWPYRTLLWLRREPNGNHREIGLTWWEWSRFQRARFQNPISISFAEVATHNHFVLDRQGMVFRQTSPVIKLPASATEDEYLALLAYLNSSTACFWMKQVFMNKGGSGIGRGIQDEAWEARFQFDGTKLRQLPVFRSERLARLGRALDERAERRLRCSAARVLKDFSSESSSELQQALDREYAEDRGLLEEMVGLQEAIDWEVYALMGLARHEQPAVELRRVRPGERSFEHRILIEADSTQWFVRNGYSPPLGIAMSEDATTRLGQVDQVPELALLERPEYKRRWLARDRAVQSNEAMREWIGDKLAVLTAAHLEVSTQRQLAERAQTIPAMVAVLELLGGLEAALKDVLVGNAVGFLSATSLTEAGLEKHALWEEMWVVQREEDAGGQSPVNTPPKYDKGDYLNDVAWRLRGRFDVPGERFIAYPFCESDTDGDPIYGWAGWDHLQRAQALGALYLNRRDNEGWSAERLTPMLAGLLELIPWIKQWHNEPSDEFGGLRMGDYYAQFLDEECRRHNLTHDDLRAWRPPKKAKKTKAARAVAQDENGEVVRKRLSALERDLKSAKHDDAKPARKKRARKAATEDVAEDRGD